MMNPKDTFISAYQKYIHRTGSDSLLDRLISSRRLPAQSSTTVSPAALCYIP